MYILYYTNDAKKDYKKIDQSVIRNKTLQLLKLIEENPFKTPPPYKKLKGAYDGLYSRRLSLKHRLFYEVDNMNKRIKIIRIWTHYGDN